ncbi:hypothetical protein CBM2633_A80049 [Cupriavidus taiwanensis]|nr:hypothetical protein CBM2604_A100247 [Cupriavidus taiwanensis]SOZ44333.1 hypothetical protein CBM2610_A120251 [Cupriavidus taiwanensis]SOZ98308.1 hypothetical protein CBM2626_A150080 [Cupriavidus taiwanensis]SPA17346.1 hypothetical protein CBM2633_A80049 [Cupriavidus taiwanensis]
MAPMWHRWASRWCTSPNARCSRCARGRAGRVTRPASRWSRSLPGSTCSAMCSTSAPRRWRWRPTCARWMRGCSRPAPCGCNGRRTTTPFHRTGRPRPVRKEARQICHDVTQPQSLHPGAAWAAHL